MDTRLEVTIHDDGKLAYRAVLAGAAEFGRQNVDEDAPYGQHAQAGLTRIVIARLDEVTVPRRLLRVEPVGAARARLSNLSKTPLRLDAGPALDPGAAREVSLPVTVAVGGKALFFRGGDDGGGAAALQSLSEERLTATLDPTASLRFASAAKSQIAGGKLDNETLLRWIQAALGMLQTAEGTPESFFRRAARALVDMVGLDFGCVLLPADGRWLPHPPSVAVRTGAGPPALAGADWQPSRRVLDSVLRERKTFWQQFGLAAASDSLVGLQSVVASPVLSNGGTVAAVLYGERGHGGPGLPEVSRLVAMLVELLAGGVAAGLARIEQERTRFLWEQFVTPELSHHLAENPDLLTGRDVEVTMLSADIRGFSRICDQLGPARTLEWVQDVLGTLSDCVLAEQGVLVDYVGDELLAMWGAPAPQPDHAARAGRHALAMLAAVPVLTARWSATVREAMGVGIGISSGTARVGNVGSARKFKYGALGTTVNLASRVQGATRLFKVPLLITGAVHDRLGPAFRTRRLSRIEVVNIPEPVTVYQLAGADAEGWDELKGGYEQALAHFEACEFRAAARVLGALLTQPPHRDDGPALLLMQRAVTCLVEQPASFSGVWKLAGKGK